MAKKFEIDEDDGRDPPRSDRARAAQRAAEIREHLGNLDEGIDEFRIDPDMIPDGWTYEWKRHTVIGMQDPSYERQLRQTGWTPVPAKRHPELMPDGSTAATIERKGMMLYERPAEITEEVRRIEQRRARLQVATKEEQLNNAPSGQLPRAGDEGGDPRIAPKIKKSFAPIPIPD